MVFTNISSESSNSIIIKNLKQIQNVCVFISKYGDVALYGREWLRGNDVIIHMKCHGHTLFYFKPGFYQKMKKNQVKHTFRTKRKLKSREVSSKQCIFVLRKAYLKIKSAGYERE